MRDIPALPEKRVGPLQLVPGSTVIGRGPVPHAPPAVAAREAAARARGEEPQPLLVHRRTHKDQRHLQPQDPDKEATHCAGDTPSLARPLIVFASTPARPSVGRSLSVDEIDHRSTVTSRVGRDKSASMERGGDPSSSTPTGAAAKPPSGRRSLSRSKDSNKENEPVLRSDRTEAGDSEGEEGDGCLNVSKLAGQVFSKPPSVMYVRLPQSFLRGNRTASLPKQIPTTSSSGGGDTQPEEEIDEELDEAATMVSKPKVPDTPKPKVPDSPKPRVRGLPKGGVGGFGGKKRAASASPSRVTPRQMPGAAFRAKSRERFIAGRDKLIAGKDRLLASKDRLVSELPPALRQILTRKPQADDDADSTDASGGGERKSRSVSRPDMPSKPHRRQGPVGRTWVKVYDDITYVDEGSDEEMYPYVAYTGRPRSVPEATPLPKAPTPPPPKQRRIDIYRDSGDFDMTPDVLPEPKFDDVSMNSHDFVPSGGGMPGRFPPVSAGEDDLKDELVALSKKMDEGEDRASQVSEYDNMTSGGEAQPDAEVAENKKSTPTARRLQEEEDARPSRGTSRFKGRRHKRMGTPIFFGRGRKGRKEEEEEEEEEVEEDKIRPDSGKKLMSYEEACSSHKPLTDAEVADLEAMIVPSVAPSAQLGTEVAEDDYIIPQPVTPPRPQRGIKIYETIKVDETTHRDAPEEPEEEDVPPPLPARWDRKEQELPVVETEEVASPPRPQRGIKVYESVVLKGKEPDETPMEVEVSAEAEEPALPVPEPEESALPVPEPEEQELPASELEQEPEQATAPPPETTEPETPKEPPSDSEVTSMEVASEAESLSSPTRPQRGIKVYDTVILAKANQEEEEEEQPMMVEEKAEGASEEDPEAQKGGGTEYKFETQMETEVVEKVVLSSDVSGDDNGEPEEVIPPRPPRGHKLYASVVIEKHDESGQALVQKVTEDVKETQEEEKMDVTEESEKAQEDQGAMPVPQQEEKEEEKGEKVAEEIKEEAKEEVEEKIPEEIKEPAKEEVEETKEETPKEEPQMVQEEAKEESPAQEGPKETPAEVEAAEVTKEEETKETTEGEGVRSVPEGEEAKETPTEAPKMEEEPKEIEAAGVSHEGEEEVGEKKEEEEEAAPQQEKKQVPPYAMVNKDGKSKELKEVEGEVGALTTSTTTAAAAAAAAGGEEEEGRSSPAPPPIPPKKKGLKTITPHPDGSYTFADLPSPPRPARHLKPKGLRPKPRRHGKHSTTPLQVNGEVDTSPSRPPRGSKLYASFEVRAMNEVNEDDLSPRAPKRHSKVVRIEDFAYVIKDDSSVSSASPTKPSRHHGKSTKAPPRHHKGAYGRAEGDSTDSPYVRGKVVLDPERNVKVYTAIKGYVPSGAVEDEAENYENVDMKDGRPVPRTRARARQRPPPPPPPPPKRGKHSAGASSDPQGKPDSSAAERVGTVGTPGPWDGANVVDSAQSVSCASAAVASDASQSRDINGPSRLESDIDRNLRTIESSFAALDTVLKTLQTYSRASPTAHLVQRQGDRPLGNDDAAGEEDESLVLLARGTDRVVVKVGEPQSEVTVSEPGSIPTRVEGDQVTPSSVGEEQVAAGAATQENTSRDVTETSQPLSAVQATTITQAITTTTTTTTPGDSEEPQKEQQQELRGDSQGEERLSEKEKKAQDIEEREKEEEKRDRSPASVTRKEEEEEKRASDVTSVAVSSEGGNKYSQPQEEALGLDKGPEKARGSEAEKSEEETAGEEKESEDVFEEAHDELPKPEEEKLELKQPEEVKEETPKEEVKEKPPQEEVREAEAKGAQEEVKEEEAAGKKEDVPPKAEGEQEPSSTSPQEDVKESRETSDVPLKEPAPAAEEKSSSTQKEEEEQTGLNLELEAGVADIASRLEGIRSALESVINHYPSINASPSSSSAEPQ
ncbi:uncharacterized protein LOC143037916 isoform X2 [Oratosquilla oratoria]|uniref:uncharacterized protein LOC143037916 isoform X2 n=1 Tax=Oratosquilla oratoria TaxID=337810 RepID=UPI003F77601B